MERNTWKHELRVHNMWIGSIHFENFWRDFVARTSALIAPGWPILHRVLCSIQMVSNAPKWKEMHQNMSLESNGMDREHLLQKILTKHRGTTFCINCTSLARFALSFVWLRNGPKCTQTEKNAWKRELRIQLYGSGAFVLRNSDKTLWHKLLL